MSTPAVPAVNGGEPETALVPAGILSGPPVHSNIVSPVVSVEEAVAAWDHYQRLTQQILDESDYQTTGQKKFKKKSAWRKYMRFYGIDEDPAATRIAVTRNGTEGLHNLTLPLGFPLYATAFVVVLSPNGKAHTGYHECHAGERCCPGAFSLPCDKKTWRGHTCCAPGCGGFAHWSHPGDIPATAHTRAKNRAISDALGAGEVSAEEISPKGSSPEGGSEERPRLHVCPECKKTGFIIKGHEQYGGGWLCYKKKGGCGWKGPDEPALEPDDDAPTPTSEHATGTTQQQPPAAGKPAKEEKPTATEKQLAESIEAEGKKLFLAACKLCLKEDLQDYLRKTLCETDLKQMDAFSKVEKLKLVMQQEAREAGAGVRMVQGFAADYRRQVASAAANAASTQKAEEFVDGIPDPKPEVLPASTPVPPAASHGSLIDRYMALAKRCGIITRGVNDGVKVINGYLQAQLGTCAVTTCQDPELKARFAGVFEGLERMPGTALRAFLLDQPPTQAATKEGE